MDNWSQKACASPVDKEAPCQPSITANGDCNTQITQITWVDGDANCSYDILYYNLYYTAVKDSQYILIDSFATDYYSKNIEFDKKFDLKSNDKMYCTELVYRILQQASGDKNFIPLTEISGVQYVACDNIYLSSNSKLIYSYSNN